MKLFSIAIILPFMYLATTSPLAANPIGGGSGYSGIITSGDYTVSTKSELLSALESARSGDIVYITPSSTIDLTGTTGIDIPSGVTLAGNRGYSGSPGPLIFNDDMPEGSHILDAESSSRITGIRIKGPDVDFDEITYQQSPFAVPPYDTPKSSAIAIRLRYADNVDVDNCEISNFHFAGVAVEKGSRNAHVHHNFLHDIHAYPVVAQNGSELPLLIEYNIIHYIWHATAGSGDIGTGYEVRYNTIVRKASPTSWQPWYDGGHAIDMHADASIKSSRGQRIAADIMTVHNNNFILDAAGDATASDALDVKVRGVPRDLVRIYDNSFFNSDPAQAVVHYDGNVWVYNNSYGGQRSSAAIAMESTPQILFNNPPPPGEQAPLLPGQISLDLDINVYGSLSLSDVDIFLNDNLIFSDSRAPNSNEVILRYADTDQSLAYQELTVVATDNRGVTAEFMTIFNMSAVLPITLSRFMGDERDGQVLLEWTTESEVDADYFAIQKKGRGDQWTDIGEVKAIGGAEQRTDYSFADPNPEAGPNAYRLKMIDLDGSLGYSQIEVVTVANTPTTYHVFPNPIVTDCYVTSSEDLLGTSYEIYDVRGVKQRQGTLDQTTTRIDLHDLRTGTYYLRIASEGAPRASTLIKQ